MVFLLRLNELNFCLVLLSCSKHAQYVISCLNLSLSTGFPNKKQWKSRGQPGPVFAKQLDQSLQCTYWVSYLGWCSYYSSESDLCRVSEATISLQSKRTSLSDSVLPNYRWLIACSKLLDDTDREAYLLQQTRYYMAPKRSFCPSLGSLFGK